MPRSVNALLTSASGDVSSHTNINIMSHARNTAEHLEAKIIERVKKLNDIWELFCELD